MSIPSLFIFGVATLAMYSYLLSLFSATQSFVVLISLSCTLEAGPHARPTLKQSLVHCQQFTHPPHDGSERRTRGNSRGANYAPHHETLQVEGVERGYILIRAVHRI